MSPRLDAWHAAIVSMFHLCYQWRPEWQTIMKGKKQYRADFGQYELRHLPGPGSVSEQDAYTMNILETVRKIFSDSRSPH